jgi:uncharacterized membrane protein
MKALLFLLVIVILGAGVWYYVSVYSAPKPVSQTTTITDTLTVVKDSIINARSFDTIPLGFYQGMLPCRSCEGLQRTIKFTDDGRYKMEEVSWGKGAQSKRTEGTWEKEKGKFLLYVNDKMVSQYRFVKDSLINIENNGSRIPDSLSRQYALFKKNTAPENPAWKKKRAEGVDIIGSGSEPFWNVEIDNEKFILFKLTTTEKPVIVPIERPSVTKDSTVYSIVTDSGFPLKISIAPKFCSDGVSDHLYEYKMTVWYKGQTYKGCAVIFNPAG